MKLNFTDNSSNSYDSFIFFNFEGKLKIDNPLLETHIKLIEKSSEINEFKGKEGQMLKLFAEINNNISEVIIVGLGKKGTFDSDIFRKCVYKALKVNDTKNSVLIYINDDSLNLPNSVVEAAIFSDYKFDKYKSKKKDTQKSIDIYSEFKGGLVKGMDKKKISESIILAKSCLLTRDLVNEPANVLYPETLAKKTLEIAKKYGFEAEIFDEDYIIENKMEAYLAVARAADYKPKLIVMKHLGNPDDKEIIGLIGKGLTYDTGGLSIKPTAGMETMKCDMGGAATVIGTMASLAKMKVKKNVVAIVAACENSIAGNSYRPGDVIDSMAGKTIEVNNTDAEGRLTLVDAIHYAIEKHDVSKIIDVATLTGAAIIALGKTTTVGVSNNKKLWSQMEKAAKKADEKVWQLPNFPEYGKLLDSKIADMKNTGGKSAGAITAAKFIEKFVQDKPWIHIDIAGTGYTDVPYNYYSQGGTGQFVKTLFYFFAD